MIENESLIGIYSYITDSYSSRPSAYYLTHLFDEGGFIEEEQAWKVFRELDFFDREGNDKKIGPFESMEKLNQFIYHLCQEIEARQACLISTADYNKCLEDFVGESVELIPRLLEAGNCIKNVDKKDKGILGKIFR